VKREEALEVMQESRAYGLAAFPVKENEADDSFTQNPSFNSLSIDSQEDNNPESSNCKAGDRFQGPKTFSQLQTTSSEAFRSITADKGSSGSRTSTVKPMSRKTAATLGGATHKIPLLNSHAFFDGSDSDDDVQFRESAPTRSNGRQTSHGRRVNAPVPSYSPAAGHINTPARTGPRKGVLRADVADTTAQAPKVPQVASAKETTETRPSGFPSAALPKGREEDEWLLRD